MLVHGATVLRRRSDGWGGERLDIEIEEGKISRFLDPGVIPPGPDDLDARNKLAIPGLANLHMHSNDNFLRGRHQQLPLELYMLHAAIPWQTVAAFDERMLEARTLLGAAEALLNGTTCLLDDCYHVGELREGGIDAVLRAYDRIGIRAMVAADLSDLPMPETVAKVPGALDPVLASEFGAHRDDWRDGLDRCLDAARRTNGARVQAMFAASAPQRCSDELLTALAGAAESAETLWTAHLMETRAQAITARERYRSTAVAHLQDLGILSERAVFAHGIWVDADDIATLSRYGAAVVHNPTSNLRLGSGVAPVISMLEGGLKVAIGTDGIACNDAQNLFLEMRLAASLHNIKGFDPSRWLGADQVLDMATKTAGEIVGPAQGRTGELEPGAHADIVLLDLESVAFTPLGGYAANLVYAESGRSVETVLVAGEVVMSGGELVSVGLDTVVGEASEEAKRYFSENAKAFERIAEFQPAFEKALAELAADPHRKNRLLDGE